jgi:pyruvate dehydrogenase E2 component (dihydrolipoamide acetyltransferase)
MVTEVIMPKMGQTMEKGRIIRWLKNEGEEVEKGEPLLEIETDKTTIEVEARDSGILRKILAQEGEDAPVATTIAYITGEGELLPEEGISKGVRAPESPTAKIQKETSIIAPKPGEITKARKASRIRASPLAKKIGEEKGVDLTQVEGSGPGGRITKEDVLKHLASKPAESSSEFQVVPMSSMRKAIAEKMVESKSHIPHFYVSTEVDMTEATKLRKDLTPTIEAETGVRLSFTHMFVKAVAIALKEYPQLNSTFEEENIKMWKDVNIGIAVSLEDGLIVPVLRKANKKSLPEITSMASKLASRAKEKRLREEEFSGGTFTISNMGALDVESFIAIINVPETAILALGKINDRPAVVEEQITIRKIMTMTLSADHRVVDGVLAAIFLKKVKNLLEEPSSLTQLP